MKVAVSIHATENFDPNSLTGLKGLDYVHIDVMDGKFVSSENLNFDVFKVIKEKFEIPIIAHLMVNNPLDHIFNIIEFCYAILFHFEIQEDLNYIIKKIKEKGKKAGIVLNPETEVSEVLKYLPLLDLVLVLGVNPGWSGQKFKLNTINKVNELATFKKQFSFLIDVDGGIDLTNAPLLEKADILTSASTILRAKDPNNVILKLKGR
ncbi:MAG: ribulose-phosphate 3-epimerase [Candidatus Heimdallarchaeota archaeon]